MVAAADHLATSAGVAILALGGNAVDAAIATNAAMAVTSPHLCGLGGDLFALVYTGGANGEVAALNASGRAGSGASADALRADGHTEMPFRKDVRVVTVPGCVEGWSALHARFGSLSMADLLQPAIALAAGGFPASPLLIGALAQLDADGRRALHELADQGRRPADRIRRPGVARTLQAIAEGGHEAFYEGEFGRGLLSIGSGWFDASDLADRFAEWVTPLTARAWGVDLHTIPPNSQGYLTLGSAALASNLDLPADPNDPHWAHLLIEAATAAGFDRPEVLHDEADGNQLLAAIADRAHMIDPAGASRRRVPGSDGDTTYLCTADGNGMAVSLIQSNASGFGSWVVEPNTQINLHNRGLGFSLQPGHPAEIGPRRRPPHTLSPALATDAHGLRSVFGTMGGDGQPQVLLQLAARLFHHGQTPAVAINAGRWVLRGPVTGFDTWTAAQGPDVMIEGHAPTEWMAALAARGHRTLATAPFDSSFGHAHAIVRDDNGWWASATEPRTLVGSAAGL